MSEKSSKQVWFGSLEELQTSFLSGIWVSNILLRSNKSSCQNKQYILLCATLIQYIDIARLNL